MRNTRDTGRVCPLERVEQQVSFGNESPRGGGDRRWYERDRKRKLDDDGGCRRARCGSARRGSF